MTDEKVPDSLGSSDVWDRLEPAINSVLAKFPDTADAIGRGEDPGESRVVGVVTIDVSARTTSMVVGNAEKAFAFASVTKLLTAMAALVAVQEGTISLDLEAGPPGSTVRHLLAHASGLRGAMDDFDPVKRSTEIVAPVGEKRIYSNLGFELLAKKIEERSGIPFPDYLEEAVTRPLGMSQCKIVGSAGWGATGSVSDLVKLAGELLLPTILDPGLMSEALSVQFPGLGGVLPGFGPMSPLDWGLGFELKDRKPRHWTGTENSEGAFGHFGQTGSFLWVDPMYGVALASLGTSLFGPWAKESWPELSDVVIRSLGERER